MVPEARQRLAQAAESNEYLNFAVNQDGKPVQGCFVPWEKTSSAFNMKTPNITLSVMDLEDPVIMEELRKCKVLGIYIMTALEDYSFIERFPGVWDLFILHGENMKDLSFTRNLTELFMFYLEEAKLPDLTPLIDNFNENLGFGGKNMGFYRCAIEDVSALESVDFIMGELLVWPNEGDSRERWKMKRRPLMFRYYTS